MTAGGAFAIAPLAAAGFAVGTGYFASLRRGAGASLARGAWRPYVTSALARIASAALLFTLAVRWGAPALLAAFAGFLAARWLALRATGKPA